MICTSKWRIPSVRLPASRTTAKTSGSIASSDSPSAKRARNSAVLARSSSSESAAIAGSSALTRSAVRRRRAMSRSLPSKRVFRKCHTGVLTFSTGKSLLREGRLGAGPAA